MGFNGMKSYRKFSQTTLWGFHVLPLRAPWYTPQNESAGSIKRGITYLFWSCTFARISLKSPAIWRIPYMAKRRLRRPWTLICKQRYQINYYFCEPLCGGAWLRRTRNVEVEDLAWRDIINFLCHYAVAHACIMNAWYCKVHIQSN